MREGDDDGRCAYIRVYVYVYVRVCGYARTCVRFPRRCHSTRRNATPTVWRGLMRAHMSSIARIRPAYPACPPSFLRDILSARRERVRRARSLLSLLFPDRIFRPPIKVLPPPPPAPRVYRYTPRRDVFLSQDRPEVAKRRKKKKKRNSLWLNSHALRSNIFESTFSFAQRFFFSSYHERCCVCVCVCTASRNKGFYSRCAGRLKSSAIFNSSRPG